MALGADGQQAALLHTRLSIIDLDPRANQPLERDGLTVAYNGEIYNYLELKAELESLGHAFETTSDTEVLLAAWRQWGPAALDRMEGMWAFALSDTRAGTLTLCRETTTPGLTPLRVQFAHERCGSIEPLVEHFGIEPVFGAAIDGIQFALVDIDRATSVGDAAIWKFFTDHLETTLPRDETAEPGLETLVVAEIAKLLSGGVPQLSEVAATLAMGPRTLQRRLSERGKTYQALVDEARRQLAQQLVSGSRYSLSEIAFLTGFSEQSAFTRAFKRWSGQTPGAYRMSSTA